jgi:hypothetical protein
MHVTSFFISCDDSRSVDNAHRCKWLDGTYASLEFQFFACAYVLMEGIEVSALRGRGLRLLR